MNLQESQEPQFQVVMAVLAQVSTGSNSTFFLHLTYFHLQHTTQTMDGLQVVAAYVAQPDQMRLGLPLVCVAWLSVGAEGFEFVSH